MSYFDVIPSLVDDWNPDGEDEREYMDEVFRTLTSYHWERRHFHDRNAFYAEEAWSEKCLALGHVETDEAEDENEHYVNGDHQYGWDYTMICLDTRYGEACSECEGECDYWDTGGDLWALPGVLAR